MKFEFKPSFERSLKQLHETEKSDVKTSACQLIDVLSNDKSIYPGR
jgi:hypothetical protein